MKKFAVVLILLLIASPVFAARYMVPVRSVYPGKNYVRKTNPTVVQVEHNKYERNYRIKSGPSYNTSKGVPYLTGAAANYGSNISPKYNYSIKSGPSYNIKPTPARTYKSGPTYQYGRR